MDFRLAVAEGIAGGAAAGLIGLIGLMLRWLWIGMKSDWQSWRRRREEKRMARLATRYSARTEPPLRR